jgi:glycosyltransferase involved in cell wall biosynthesis
MDEVDTPHRPAIRGTIDGADTRGVVRGWCWWPQEPGTRRTVALLLNGAIVANIRCDQFRDDLRASDIGDGNHAFVVVVPEATAVFHEGDVVTLHDLATDTQVRNARAVVTEEAQIQSAQRALPTVAGHLDSVSAAGIVNGWCWHPPQPDRHVAVEIVVDDEMAGTAIANLYRSDLRQAGIGLGDHGLCFALPQQVMTSRRSLRVALRDAESQAKIGDPFVLHRPSNAAVNRRLRDLERRLLAMQVRLDAMARDANVDHDFDLHSRGSQPLLNLTVPALPVATVCMEAGPSRAWLYDSVIAMQRIGVDRLANIVLIDDGMVPVVATLPALIGGLGYVRLLGAHPLLAGRNHAGLAMPGQFVVFLARGIRVTEDWLRHVQATFEQEKRAAIVGTRIVQEDGVLYRSGIFADPQGHLHEVQESDDPEAMEASVMQQVGAIGDGAFAVCREDFQRAGGFDLSLGGSEAAVLDLCLRVRAAGREVFYQPGAVACLSRPDRTSDERAAFDLAPPDDQVLQPWQRWLEQTRQSPGALAVPPPLGHALVIDTITPRPDQDAGSAATREHMLALRRLGYHVTFAAIERRHGDDAYDAALQHAGIYTMKWWQHDSLVGFLADAGGQLDLIVVNRYYNLQLLSEQLARLAPQARLVFVPHDLHHLREQRRMAIAGEVDETLIELLRQQELACMRRADATILASDVELALVSLEIERQKLHLLRWVGRTRPPARPFPERRGLCFLANFEHRPNEDGLFWFVQQILPLIMDRVPDTVLHIAGSHMPLRIRDLASDHIVVHGWVRDLKSLFETVRLVVAPLRYGAGFKGKVATSMMHGVPVVATSIALEGMGLQAGEGVLNADTPEAFADAVVRLHDDAALWRDLSAQAVARSEALYSEARAQQVYSDLLASLGLPTRLLGG